MEEGKELRDLRKSEATSIDILREQQKRELWSHKTREASQVYLPFQSAELVSHAGSPRKILDPLICKMSIMTPSCRDLL